MCLPKQLTTPLAKQLWVVIPIYFTMLGNGMVLGISNSMLPELLAPDSDIHVDMEAASWLNALTGFGSLCGYFISCVLLANCGRRGGTIIGLAPCIISPLICYLATDLKTLLVGRFIAGIDSSSVGIAVTIGEYTTPIYRGVFLSLKSCMFAVGFTVAHMLGHYLHWRTILLIMTVFFLFTFLMAFTWPESSFWLANRHRYDEATLSFHWLRGKSEKSTTELNATIEAQKKLRLGENLSKKEKVMQLMGKFKKRNFLKPLGVYFFVAMLLETSGRHMFPAYVMYFIQQMDKDTSNIFLYTLCIDLITCLSSVASIVLVKIIKRRTLLLSSGAASVVVLLAVSLYYYLQSMSLLSDKWNPMFIVLFAAYFVFINIGCSPISLALIGELFPLEHRSLASSMGGVFISIFMFVILKITPFLLTNLKVYGTFAVYGVCMCVCLIVLYVTLPETKDKTLQEIEEYFNDTVIKERKVRCNVGLDVNDKLLENRHNDDSSGKMVK